MLMIQERQFSLRECFWWLTWMALVACEVPFAAAVGGNQGIPSFELAVATTIVGIGLVHSAKKITVVKAAAIFGWATMQMCLILYLITLLPNH